MPCEQMRLADARGPMDQQRRELARPLENRLGGRPSEPVGRSGDERAERGEAAALGAAASRRGGRRRRPFARGLGSRAHRAVEFGAGRRGGGGLRQRGVDQEVQRWATAQHHRAGVFDRLAKRGAEPIAEESVRRADGERAVGELEPRAGAEPQLEAFFSDPVGERGTQSRHDVHIVRGHFLTVPGARHPRKTTPSWRLVFPRETGGDMGNEAL